MGYRKPTLSASAIETACQCAVKYREQYVLRKPWPVRSEMAFGTSVHNAQEVNFIQKVHTRKDLKLGECQDAFRSKWASAVSEIEWTKDEKGSPRLRGAYIDEGVKTVRKAWKDLWPSIQPFSVEQYFRIELEDFDYDLTGKIDVLAEINRVRVPDAIRDLKCPTKSPTKDALDRNIQVTIYAMAFWMLNGKRLPDLIQFDYLVRLKRGPKLEERQTSRTLNQFQKITNVMRKIGEMQKSGIYMPAPAGAWWCSSTYCPYWYGCTERLY